MLRNDTHSVNHALVGVCVGFFVDFFIGFYVYVCRHVYVYVSWVLVCLGKCVSRVAFWEVVILGSMWPFQAFLHVPHPRWSYFGGGGENLRNR